MAVTERSWSVTRREFLASVSPGFGATHTDVAKAWKNAEQSFRETHKLPADHALTDDALAFWPGDEHIVISYETQAPATVSVEDAARLLAAYDHACGRVTMPYANLLAEDQQKYLDMAQEVINKGALTRSRAQTPPAPKPAPAPVPVPAQR